jgi:hypothetical protein
LLGVLLFFAAVRFRLRDMPLERDEGEFAYGGQLLLQGLWPGASLYTMKLPGTHAAYAVLMAVFGQSCAGVHLGFLLVNIATITLLFLLSRALVGTLAAVVAAATYGLASLSPDLLGTSAHATHFVVLPVLAGLLLLWRAGTTGRGGTYLAAGFLLSSSVLMKHNGILFLGFGALWLAGLAVARRGDSKPAFGKRAAAFALGVMTPWLLLLLVLWPAGALEQSWFWSVTYARAYAKPNPGATLVWLGLMQRMPAVLQPALYAGLAGLVALWWQRGAKSVALFATGWLVFSGFAVVPGLHFRPHYYVVLLPVLALLTGALVQGATGWLGRGRWKLLAAIPSLVFVLMLARGILRERDFLFQMTPLAACRSLYGSEPFPEAREVADYIRVHSAPDARIAVLGSEPEIHFYARRRSATGFVYMYPLLERQPFAAPMRAQLRQEIAAAQPQFIVQVRSWTSWLSRSAGPERLDELSAPLLPANYRLIATCDLLPEASRGVWHWPPEAVAPPHPPSRVLLLFERVDAKDAATATPNEPTATHAL